MTNEEFESAVLDALTAGDHPVFEALREQRKAMTVDRREETEGGFFAYFSVDRDAPRVKPPNLIVGDLQLQLEGASTPADAVLHVRNGAVDVLECYVFDGVWPESPEITGVYYYGGETFASIGPELFASRDVDAAFDEE